MCLSLLAAQIKDQFPIRNRPKSIMSWFWKSSQPKENAPPPKPSELKSDNELYPPSDASAPGTSPKNVRLSRDEQAFADLKSLISPTDVERTERALKAKKETTQDPNQESLYPNTMSCAQCWDMAYACSSVAGQLRNVYRYGGARSCTELWAQWRFCMRTKAMGDDKAKMRIREWNQRKAARYKRGRSSEDVWVSRSEEELVEDPFPDASSVVVEREFMREFLLKAREREETVYWSAFIEDLQRKGFFSPDTRSQETRQPQDFRNEEDILGNIDLARTAQGRTT